MKPYLFSVHRDSTDASVVAAVVETSHPSKVEAQHLENGRVRLVDDKGQVLATSSQVYDDDGETFTLHRWAGAPAGDEEPSRKPTSKPVPRRR